MKHLMDWYYNGSPGKPDFTANDLPTTRVQLFFTVLRVRLRGLVQENLLYLGCWLPAIIWTILNLLTVQFKLSDPNFTRETLSGMLPVYLFILAPLIAFTGPFNMGISYVMRNWARDQHAYAFIDFRDAIRENWRQGLLFGMINGCIPFVAGLGLRFYLNMADSSPIFYLPVFIILLALTIWSLCAQLLPTMIVTYSLRFSQHVRNALLLVFVTLPRAISIKLATLLFPLIMLLCAYVSPAAFGWVSAIVLALYAVVLIAFNKLLVASYANASCEKYLNSKITGATINIGLNIAGQQADDNEDDPSSDL